jgi:hypothetical protein
LQADAAGSPPTAACIAAAGSNATCGSNATGGSWQQCISQQHSGGQHQQEDWQELILTSSCGGLCWCVRVDRQHIDMNLEELGLLLQHVLQ